MDDVLGDTDNCVEGTKPEAAPFCQEHETAVCSHLDRSRIRDLSLEARPSITLKGPPS